MPEENNILDMIISEFPNRKKEITILFDESSIFIEICQDYVLCLESIHRLKLKKEPFMKKEISELEWALGELKEELLSRI
jgi:hypothetical protein